ncbi:MAG: DUF3179 domain-containing (seleno)protein [Candidatus Promineifilaceae bacterium]|nr:DUF3179 domain-containing (seleno)protein [Candidatus Promineifilaceae bacterium]
MIESNKRFLVCFLLIVTSLFLVACNAAQESETSESGVETAEDPGSEQQVEDQSAEEQSTADKSAVEEENPEESDAEIGAVETPNQEVNPTGEEEQDAEEATATSVPEEPTAEPPTATPAEPTTEPELIDGIAQVDDRPDGLRQVTNGWATNWDQHTIAYDELLAGGPSRDGIPSIDNPNFITLEETAGLIADIEPVIAFELNGEARAYPLQILIWHEIVNDMIGDTPILVTFCPLCNSALVFDRRVNGETLEFGTSGLLRNSDLVMYDRSTESLWQQFTGEGIVGEMVGQMLEFLPSSIVSLADFEQAYPEGLVLSPQTGYDRPYGVNPYTGYDTYEHPLSLDGEMVLLSGEQDRRFPAAERVVAVSLDDQGIDIAYPLSVLSELGAINDRQGDQDIVVLFQSGTNSALGSQVIIFADDVGATGVFDPNFDGQKLTFTNDGETITDNETGSRWNILGQSVEGPLAGSSLRPLVHGDHFWFAWAAFKPETIIYEGPSEG